MTSNVLVVFNITFQAKFNIIIKNIKNKTRTIELEVRLTYKYKNLDYRKIIKSVVDNVGIE